MHDDSNRFRLFEDHYWTSWSYLATPPPTEADCNRLKLPLVVQEQLLRRLFGYNWIFEFSSLLFVHFVSSSPTYDIHLVSMMKNLVCVKIPFCYIS